MKEIVETGMSFYLPRNNNNISSNININIIIFHFDPLVVPVASNIASCVTMHVYSCFYWSIDESYNALLYKA